MMYQAEKIIEVVNNINVKYFLPYIQRELVWNPKQIRKLLDSLMRHYPINTFLFWRLSTKKEEISKLEFIKDYVKDVSKNTPNNDTDKGEYFLVLDGQQRLQSFFISLKGTYNEKELFFNVLSKKVIEESDDGDDENDEEESEIIYETDFFKRKEQYFLQEKESSGKKLWVKVKAFALLNEDSIFSYVKKLQEEFGKEILHEEANLLEKNIKKLNNMINNKEVIFYYLEQEEDYDKVLDIFIRTNSGGTKLSKSDLLFSIIKRKWTIDAFTEFNKLTKEINNKGDFKFDNDFILKTALVIINKDIKYRVENFSNKNVALIEDTWDELKYSIKTVVDFLTSIGITNEKMLRSKNSIIPLVNYTYVNKIKTYTSEEKSIVENRKNMQSWVYKALLTNLFSGQTDEILRTTRKVINENKGKTFPDKEINLNLPSGKNLIIKKEEFGKIHYNSGRDFFVLGLLYPDINLNPTSERNIVHKDHIFPKDILDGKYPEDLINNIGNLEILTATENESKNNIPFEKWICSRDNSFLQRNIIPKFEDFSIDIFENFVKSRCDIMFNKLQSILKNN